MPNQFLERNKKKSLLALLLLLLRWRRGLAPALLTVILLMLVFIGPRRSLGWLADGLGKLPYGQRLAARLEREIAPPAAAATRSELERLLAMLRLTRGQAGSNQALSAQRGRALGAAADSIAMVWGDRGEPGPLPAVRRIQGGTTISAIPTPERLRDEDDSVALRPGDLQGRRQALLRRLLSGGWSGQAGDGQGAYASSVLGGPGGPGGSAGSMDSTGSMGLTAGEFSAAGVSASGAYAGKGFFSGGSFAAAGPALPAGAGAAGGPGSGNLHATVQNGRLSRMGAEQLQRGVRGLSNKLPVHGGLSPMKQLADGNVRSTIASAPDCSPANGCPPEYASTNTGAVYDGNPIGADDVGYLGSGAGVTGLDGVSTPDVTPPSETTLDGLQSQADQILAERQSCEQARSAYGAAEQQCSSGTDQVYDKFVQAGCQDYGHSMGIFQSLFCFFGIGDCDKRKRCKNFANQFKDQCQRCDSLMAQAYYSCPLNSEPFVHQDCNQVAGASGAPGAAPVWSD